MEIDFKTLDFIEASGIALLASFVRQQLCRSRPVLFLNAPKCFPFEYLQRMDFFRHFGLFKDEQFARHPQAGRFATMMRIDSNCDPKAVATELADTIGDAKLQLKSDLHNCLFESICNIVDHAGTTGFAVAQSYDRDGGTDRRYSISIADPGVGLKRSLSCNRKLTIPDHRSATELACNTSISGSPNAKDEFGYSRNQGQGLYQIDQIVKSTGGGFSLLSGNYRRRRMSDRVKFIECNHWQGTVLSINLSRSRMNEYVQRTKTSAPIRLG